MNNIKEKLLNLAVEIDAAGFSREASELDLIMSNAEDEAAEEQELFEDAGEESALMMIVALVLDLSKNNGFSDEEIIKAVEEVLESINNSDNSIVETLEA